MKNGIPGARACAASTTTTGSAAAPPRGPAVILAALAAAGGWMAAAVPSPAHAQEARYLAPPDQVVVVRAARMFDPASGQLRSNQVIVVKGDRIAEVGADAAVPAGAVTIDLGDAIVLPGMIDTHVHVNTGGKTPAQRALIALANAQTDLNAGFTTVLDMDSRGGFNTVDLRDAIRHGFVQGPRMQVVGQAINQRASDYYPDSESRYWEGFTEGKNVNSPDLARAAVREAKLHGVDFIKIYTTQDFVGQMQMWRPDATLVNSPSLSYAEVQAIVDEAHRLGLKVACHAYGGEGMQSCINAGVDAPNHLLGLDEAGVKVLLQKGLPYVPTVDDLVTHEKGDLRETGGRNSRLRLLEQAFKRALAAGVPIVFGSGVTSAEIPHGRQANQFKYFVTWGMTPVQALQTTYLPAARMLNYGWETEIGSIEKGKFADIIAVRGNPLDDVTEMERVRFVMKGGLIVRDELSRRAATH